MSATPTHILLTDVDSPTSILSRLINLEVMIDTLGSICMQEAEKTLIEIQALYREFYSEVEYIFYKTLTTIIVIKRFTLYTPLNRGRGPPQNQ